MKKWQWFKYDALGNTYLIIPAEKGNAQESLCISPSCQTLCHKSEGFDTDGVLYGPLPSKVADYKVRIFNPDGSEAEKSGNGIRIFAKYLWDEGFVNKKLITLETLGGIVTCSYGEDTRVITVDMGRYSFYSEDIPLIGTAREVLQETLIIKGQKLSYSAVTVGNPHCVIFVKEPTKHLAKCLGPLIEKHAYFLNRINVQFACVIDSKTIKVEIWERGAGYTLASGSSSCAVAAVAHRLGYCGNKVDVQMPGGTLYVEIKASKTLRLKGPVSYVGTYEAKVNLLERVGTLS